MRPCKMSNPHTHELAIPYLALIEPQLKYSKHAAVFEWEDGFAFLYIEREVPDRDASPFARLELNANSFKSGGRRAEWGVVLRMPDSADSGLHFMGYGARGSHFYNDEVHELHIRHKEGVDVWRIGPNSCTNPSTIDRTYTGSKRGKGRNP